MREGGISLSFCFGKQLKGIELQEDFAWLVVRSRYDIKLTPR